MVRQVEVVYRCNQVNDFVITDDLIQRLMDTSARYLLIIAGGCSLVLGISIGVLSWPVTGVALQGPES